ncbi:B-enzyme [Lachnospiraceae bacterium]|nr:B-enzyme [Lachnospiraceae bacterium]
MDESVDVNGTSCSSFVVEDRGNPSNRTTYWIDIYFGLNNTSNYNAAINYGVKTVSYYYYY